MRVIIVINGNNAEPYGGVAVHPGSYVISLPFSQPIELSVEDHINFKLYRVMVMKSIAWYRS